MHGNAKKKFFLKNRVSTKECDYVSLNEFLEGV